MLAGHASGCWRSALGAGVRPPAYHILDYQTKVSGRQFWDEPMRISLPAMLNYNNPISQMRLLSIYVSNSHSPVKDCVTYFRQALFVKSVLDRYNL